MGVRLIWVEVTSDGLAIAQGHGAAIYGFRATGKGAGEQDFEVTFLTGTPDGDDGTLLNTLRVPATGTVIDEVSGNGNYIYADDGIYIKGGSHMDTGAVLVPWTSVGYE